MAKPSPDEICWQSKSNVTSGATPSSQMASYCSTNFSDSVGILANGAVEEMYIDKFRYYILLYVHKTSNFEEMKKHTKWRGGSAERYGR